MAISVTRHPSTFPPVHSTALTGLYNRMHGLELIDTGSLTHEHSIHRTQHEANSARITFRTYLRSVLEYEPDSLYARFISSHAILTKLERNPTLAYHAVILHIRKRYGL